jgi:hypothetical protein
MIIEQHVLAEWVDRTQNIFPAEAVCGIAAPLNHCQALMGQDIIWFIDNKAAASSLIKGSSTQPDVHSIAQTFHIIMLSLKCRCWIEWIDSASNPSDGLSRDGLLDSWTLQQGWNLAEASLPLWASKRMTPQALWSTLQL